MRSTASTVDEYLAELPDDRRDAIQAVRDVILGHLPDGFEEAMNWGMIAYQVPLPSHPDTYNGQPLMYAALARLDSTSALNSSSTTSCLTLFSGLR